MFNLADHLKQLSSVHGISGIVAILGSVMSGVMSWQVAVPLLVAAVVAVILPDNTNAQNTSKVVATDFVQIAPTVATDVNAVISAFKSGLDHGITIAPTVQTAPATTESTPAPTASAATVVTPVQ